MSNEIPPRSLSTTMSTGFHSRLIQEPLCRAGHFGDISQTESSRVDFNRVLASDTSESTIRRPRSDLLPRLLQCEILLGQQLLSKAILLPQQSQQPMLCANVLVPEALRLLRPVRQNPFRFITKWQINRR